MARQALKTFENKRQANNESCDDCRVLFPLGFGYRKIQPYKIIKCSQFLFCTPNQRVKFGAASGEMQQNMRLWSGRCSRYAEVTVGVNRLPD